MSMPGLARSSAPPSRQSSGSAELVLPLVIVGMMLASTTRSPPTPRTRRWLSTTAGGSSARPCAPCPPGEKWCWRCRRARLHQFLVAVELRARGFHSCGWYLASAGCATMRRVTRSESAATARSSSVAQIVGRDARRIAGSRALRMCTLPRLVGLRLQTLAVKAGKLSSGWSKARRLSGCTWYCRLAMRARGDRCARRRRAARAPCSSARCAATRIRAPMPGLAAETRASVFSVRTPLHLEHRRGSAGDPAGSRPRRAGRAARRCRARAAAPPGRCPTAAGVAAMPMAPARQDDFARGAHAMTLPRVVQDVDPGAALGARRLDLDHAAVRPARVSRR